MALSKGEAMNPGIRTGWLAVAALACLFAIGRTAEAQEAATLFDKLVAQLPPAPHEDLFGARIQRTVSLLNDSSPERRYPVTILVYGQSITENLKRANLDQALKGKFPYADITFLNRSISGFSASQLVRSAANDIYPLYPDLVILHDYGAGLIEFERIIQDIRRYTTAEIMLCTHHIGGDEEAGRITSQDNESAVIRHLAQKYDCELADVREEWRAYLKANHLAPKELLSDSVHPNERGRNVWAGILFRHFRYNPLIPNDWMRTVRTYEAKRQPDDGASDGVVFTGKPWRFAGASAIGESRESALKLAFTGNRVDCVLGGAEGGKLGTATVRIDGQSPSGMNDLWAFTIPSPAFGTDWQPAIRRVSHRQPPIAETWRLVVTNINADASHFSFAVYGSKTGFDGGGEFDGAKYKYGPYGDILDYTGDAPYPDVFTSKSGRVVIDHRDFKIPWAQSYSKKPCPEGFETTWEAIPLFTETIAPSPGADRSKIRVLTLAKGLPNGAHTLEIVPDGNGAVPIESIVVHEPPLK
jgi:hypothetical protein